VDIRSSTFVANHAVMGSAISTEGSSWDERVHVSRSIVAYGTGDGAFECDSGESEFDCVDSFGNEGEEFGFCGVGRTRCFNQNPGFCDWITVDLTLLDTSPCLPGAHPEGETAASSGRSMSGVRPPRSPPARGRG
jgi:hypothetical protein